MTIGVPTVLPLSITYLTLQCQENQKSLRDILYPQLTAAGTLESLKIEGAKHRSSTNNLPQARTARIFNLKSVFIDATSPDCSALDFLHRIHTPEDARV